MRSILQDISIFCGACGIERDDFNAEYQENSLCLHLHGACPKCMEIIDRRKKREEEPIQIRVECTKCGVERARVSTDKKYNVEYIPIDPVCSSCKEKEEEKFDMDMGVVGPAQIECAACGKLNMSPHTLGTIIGPGSIYFCACGARLKITKTRKQNVWETEGFEVEKVTPAEGDWIEVTDCVTDNGFNTRISAGSSNTEIDGVEAFPRRGRVKIHWKYWRYLGEKKWRE